MKLLWTGIGFLLLLTTFAAGQTASPAGVIGGRIERFAGGSIGSLAGRASFDISPGIIKGAPFSGDVITEFDRPLADGNRIHQETHGRMFRDSEGRTRTETETLISGESYHHIFILDPVEQVSISLDERYKNATVFHFASSAQPTATTRPPVTPPPPVAPARPEFKTESLGSRQIEGFTATGTRDTRTVQAGEIGNEKPLVTTNEVWRSAELQTTLLVTTDDPQTGKTTTRLVNIQTGEPDPQLFRVPADYTVKDNTPQK